jgi:hypothetical protein
MRISKSTLALARHINRKLKLKGAARLHSAEPAPGSAADTSAAPGADTSRRSSGDTLPPSPGDAMQAGLTPGPPLAK